MIKGRYLPGVIMLCVAFLMLGCSSKSTPKGEFKKFNLRSEAPADVATVLDDQATEHIKEIILKDTGKRVLLKWHTFQKGNSRYNLSAVIDVPEQLDGIALTEAAIDPGFNLSSKDSALYTHVLRIKWDSSNFLYETTESLMTSFKADGTVSDTEPIQNQ